MTFLRKLFRGREPKQNQKGIIFLDDMSWNDFYELLRRWLETSEEYIILRRKDIQITGYVEGGDQLTKEQVFQILQDFGHTLMDR